MEKEPDYRGVDNPRRKASPGAYVGDCEINYIFGRMIYMKKVFSMLLALVMVFSLAAPALAAEEPKTIYDLEPYLELTSEGKIAFDSTTAACDGFPAEMISQIAGNAAIMNQMVDDGIAYIDETFTATIRASMARTTTNSYVTTNIWGVTDVYLSTADTQKLLNYMNTTVSYLPMPSLVQVLQSLSSLTPADVAYLGYATFSASVYVYRSSIKTAAAKGNGIVISYHQDSTTAAGGFVVISSR